MCYSRTGDPLDDFNRRDKLQAEWEASLPKCDNCGHPIQDPKYFRINGVNYCKHCMETDFEVENEELTP